MALQKSTKIKKVALKSTLVKAGNLKLNKMEASKSMYKSKIFWLNLTVGLLAIIDIITPEALNMFELELLTQHKLMGALGLLVAVLNIILRSITNTAATFKSDNDLTIKGND